MNTKTIFMAIAMLWSAAVSTAGATIQQSSVTKDGITWTFSQAVPVGQFVNGDYYVVGPVTVTAISPAPTTSDPYMNGSVLNLPTPSGKSGWDSRLNDGVDESWWFDASVRKYPPIALKPGDALVSSISLSAAQYHNVPEVMRSFDMNCSPNRTMSILTVLNTEVSSDAFRPSYCDRNQTIYYANNLQRNLLPSLAPPNPAGTPTLAQFETWFRRPWVDVSPFNFDVPAEYMPSYSAHGAFAVGVAGLLLSLDFPAAQKVNLTNYLVQYGIDLCGCVQAGYGWPAFGGHRSGRKFPIIFAGLLLNNDAMKNVSSAYPDRFGEDMQTMYVNQTPPAGTYQRAWQGATAVYGGHYGVHVDGTPVSAGLYGPYEHLQPRSWPTYSGGFLGENYRRCCTSVTWVGEALATRLLGAKDAWNHSAFFDSVDRWMNEDDTQAVAEILAQTGTDYSVDWQRQRQTRYMLQGGFPQYTFIDDMWAAYGPKAQGLVVNAGVDQTITFPANTVNLHGMVTLDGNPPGPAVTILWSQVSGPAVIVFSDTHVADTVATLSVAGTYTVRLTAMNGSLIVSDDAIVTVNPAPSGDSFTINVHEGLNPFSVAVTGNYRLTGLVNAPHDGANSYYVDIDQDPAGDNTRTWDMEITTTFQLQDVSWRGNCDYTCAQYDPKIFSITAGAHTLYIQTREPGTQIQTMTFTRLTDYGDVSENGSVSAYDASLASQYAVGLITLTSTQITKADVSGNSSVSAYDASLIAQYAVGLITKFPVEG